jgi:hypothetical protein
VDKLREFRNHLQLRKTQSQNRMIFKSYLRAVRGWVDHTQNLHNRPRWICFRTLCLIGSRSDLIHFSLGFNPNWDVAFAKRDPINAQYLTTATEDVLNNAKVSDAA